jgi:hypothetical protein
MTFMVSPRNPFAAVRSTKDMKKNSLRSRHRTPVTRDRQWLAMSVAGGIAADGLRPPNRETRDTDENAMA